MTNSFDMPSVDWDEDQLFTELGKVLVGAEAGYGPGDPESWRRYAVTWFNKRKASFKDRICGDTTIQALMAGDAYDRLAEVAVVTDALAGMLGHPSATIVAVIIVKRGVATLCSE
jgi:hypothetical protein